MLKTRVSGMKEPLANLRHELEATKNADRVLVDLKSAVSATMMKMQLFFEFAVLEPIRFIGLDEDMLLSDYFPDDPSSIESASVLQGAGEALHAAYAKRSMKSPLADMDLRELLIRALKM